jgi:hypothetical protein
MKKPHQFSASDQPFKIEISAPCEVSGYRDGDRHALFYRPIPVRKGDTFRAAPGGILLNGSFVKRSARPLKKMVWQVSWVAQRLRMAVFADRDRIWNRRTKKPTNRFGKPYWVACDLRSYHVGTGKTVPEAVKALILQCQVTNLGALEEEAQGNRVVRWRCLLPPGEVKEMERKAAKTGFILDGVQVPPIPKAWAAGLEKLKERAKQRKHGKRA